ncbi:hypothetical protein CBR_g39901 [Chara braunii]|uniref:Uncharacterized protein n=1 Tax=Chara braunii TaxID=69332 RepID=A0A388LSN2_CHABU|nr:hypothetical protein CBR_g39901 [Chara braunii]|eukprot:GBG85334.1 hypothetical protein CBR_g39901 [Chara braunii]
MEACTGSARFSGHKAKLQELLSLPLRQLELLGEWPPLAAGQGCQTLPPRTMFASMTGSPTLPSTRWVQVGSVCRSRKGRSAVPVIHCTQSDGNHQVEGSRLLTHRIRSKGCRLLGGMVTDDATIDSYVGYSRNILVSPRQFHVWMGIEKTANVRLKVFTDKAVLTRAKLAQKRDRRWLGDLTGGDLLPPGNADEKGLWEGRDGSSNGSAVIAMTDEERAAYKETKLKLRKAMGENLYDGVEGEDEDSRQWRPNLLRDVET